MRLVAFGVRGLRSEPRPATVLRMQEALSYRHRVITEDDIVFIRRLIAEGERRGQVLNLASLS